MTYDEPLTPVERDSLDGHEPQEAQYEQEHVSIGGLGFPVMTYEQLLDAALECAECEQPILFDTLAAVWFHLVPSDNEPAHKAFPACTCQPSEIDPMCREHGLEDVTNGCYDRSVNVQRRIHVELAGRIEP